MLRLRQRRLTLSLLYWKHRRRFSSSKRLLCVLLVTVGICCCTWMTRTLLSSRQTLSNRYPRSRNSSPAPKVYSVKEILNFPKNYHAKGVLSLPYGDIVEPFEAWYSAEKKMSRIDYYGGMDQTYQRELLGKHGFACKVVPEFSETTQKTFRGCLHRRGTERFPVRAQSIVPTSHYFKYVGDVMLRGRQTAKWQHKFTIYNKVNTYILYTTKNRHVKPVRYEMMGYDTLLSSYYDHYVLDYELFEAWKFDYSTFQIPTDLDCFDFTQRKFSKIVGELNPMLEFMPHTDNGAPFTFSHNPLREDTSSKLKSTESWNNTFKSFNYPSEGLDASPEFDKRVSAEGNEPSWSDHNVPSQKSKDTLSDRIVTAKDLTRPTDNTLLTPNYKNYQNDYGSRKWDANGNANSQYGLPFRRVIKNNRPSYGGVYAYVNKKVYESPKQKNAFRMPGFHRKRKIHSKSFLRKTGSKINRGKTIYSWASSRKSRQDVHAIKATKLHKSYKAHFKKRKKLPKHLKSFKSGNHQKNLAKSERASKILLKNYEDIVNVLFESFKLDHNKGYSSYHEHETRKDIYRHNLRFIMSRNRMHLGYKLRPNHLMDMTDTEIQKQKGLLDDDDDVFNGGIPFKSTSGHVPKHMDWRNDGAVNSVRSQGICGSCYAYAVTGALEGAYFLKHGELPDLSEQEIIDCSWGFGNRGCKGGYPYRAMQWILKHGGLATDGSYGKYLAQEGYCHFMNVSVGVTVESYMNISKGNVTQLKQALAQYGPVSVLINTQPKSFKFYSSGVYHDPECGTNHDHAALAVGYGEENDTPYWLIKNSWSKAWGDSGYIKITQRGNNCGVTSKAVVVKIK